MVFCLLITYFQSHGVEGKKGDVCTLTGRQQAASQHYGVKTFSWSAVTGFLISNIAFFPNSIISSWDVSRFIVQAITDDCLIQTRTIITYYTLNILRRAPLDKRAEVRAGSNTPIMPLWQLQYRTLQRHFIVSLLSIWLFAQPPALRAPFRQSFFMAPLLRRLSFCNNIHRTNVKFIQYYLTLYEFIHLNLVIQTCMYDIIYNKTQNNSNLAVEK